MLPNIKQGLAWLNNNPNAINNLNRGIERETLRVTKNFKLALTPHNPKLGSALTHSLITTDFSESLLEFVTPVCSNISELEAILHDIHCFTTRNIGDELLWPLSFPCFINDENDIPLAQYGKSNIGKFKTLYREGLKNRYGSLMQTIAGIHFNFSFSDEYWQLKFGDLNKSELQDQISSRYFNCIRNYHRYGWIIPYLFGASPALCGSFIQGRELCLDFKRSASKSMVYLPYATSLRLSDLGYTNNQQKSLAISYNNINDYITSLNHAVHSPSEQFMEIGLKDEHGNYKQINTNILQIENEFYAPIRPKRAPSSSDQTTLDALSQDGVQYIEVRALDLNPFEPTGISAEQIRFLDLFMLWCELADASLIDEIELECCRKNWNKVILEGRKPQQTIGFGCETDQYPLQQIALQLFDALLGIAKILDANKQTDDYTTNCNNLIKMVNDPSKTLSGQVLDCALEQGLKNFGLNKAIEYQKYFSQQTYIKYNQHDFEQMASFSINKQKQIEEQDKLSFDQYLEFRNQKI